MERRKFLAITSAVIIPFLSGCSNGSEDTDESETDESESTTSGTSPSESENTEEGESGESEETHEENDGDSNNDNLPNVEAVIEYTGDWSGEIKVDGTSSSISGSGNNKRTINVEEDTSTVGVTIQKDDSTNNELKVKLLVNGEVETEGSSDATSGTVSLTISV